MDNMKHRRLQQMDRSDFEIVEGEPDIRGWDVRNIRGQKLGEVEDLIIDAQKKKVRYIILDMDDNEVDMEDRKVLIPIGLAELHQKDDDVVVPVEIHQLRALPGYDSDKLDDSVEQQICSAFGRETTHLGRDKYTEKSRNKNESENDFYGHDYFNDDNLYKNRLHEARPASTRDTEYEHGLRLWERRSEGGILSGSSENEPNFSGRKEKNENSRGRDIKEEERLEMVRNRRNNYEQRRNNDRANSDSYQDNVRDYREDDFMKRRTGDEGPRGV